jgi:hypothetical protein
MLFDQSLNPVNLCPAKPLVALQADWTQPKFSLTLVSFNMDVGWLSAIA